MVANIDAIGRRICELYLCMRNGYVFECAIQITRLDLAKKDLGLRVHTVIVGGSSTGSLEELSTKVHTFGQIVQ